MLLYRKAYTLFLYFLLPFIYLRWLIKSVKEPLYRYQMFSRVGIYQTPKASMDIWFHAVSFGEMEVARQFVDSALENNAKVLLTTTTASGFERAQTLFGNQVTITFSPLDIPFAIKRLLKHFSPKKYVVIETEIWPNMLYQVHSEDIPIALINARLSLKSFKGYQKIRSFISQVLNNISVVCAQTKDDAHHFIKLGLAAERVCICGSVKFDIKPKDCLKSPADILGMSPSFSFIFLAVSTHKGEERLLLETFKRFKETHKHALMILAPRHVSRSTDILNEIQRQSLTVSIRSQTEQIEDNIDVYLVDKMGELECYYPLCDVCFVGGSLIPRGGHNVLEPIYYQKPVITGPHTFNFQYICHVLREQSALVEVTSGSDLYQRLLQLAYDPKQSQNIAERAKKILLKHQGSFDKQWRIIERL